MHNKPQLARSTHVGYVEWVFGRDSLRITTFFFARLQSWDLLDLGLYNNYLWRHHRSRRTFSTRSPGGTIAQLYLEFASRSWWVLGSAMTILVHH